MGHAILRINFRKMTYLTHDEIVYEEFFKKFSKYEEGFGNGIYDCSGRLCGGTQPYYFNSMEGGHNESFGSHDEIYEKLISCGVKPWEIKEIVVKYIKR